MLVKLRTLRVIITSPNEADIHLSIEHTMRMAHELSPFAYIDVTLNPEEDDVLVPK